MNGNRRRAVYLADTMLDVRHVEGLADHFDVTVVSAARLGEDGANAWPPRAPAEVVLLQLGGGRVGWVFRAVSWLVRHRDDVDVVFALDNVTAALAATTARRLGGPGVVLQVGRPTVEYIRCQAETVNRWRHWARLTLARVLVHMTERGADGIGAVSDYCAEQCRRHNANVVSIPWYGVDTTVFDARWTKEEARAILGLPQDQPIVMYRSRIAPEKDPVTFLEGVRLLRRRRAVCAVYMGGEFAEMQALADAAGVEVIARAPSTRDEIPVWYVAADVDVQTSLAEGLGVSPLEAMACGTPIVVSDTGGLREVAENGRAGLIVPVRDPAAVAEAIERLLDDAQLRTSLVERGRSWIHERFTEPAAFEAWVELGEAVARSRR